MFLQSKDENGLPTASRKENKGGAYTTHYVPAMEVQGQVAAEAALPHAIAGRGGETPAKRSSRTGSANTNYYCIHASPDKNRLHWHAESQTSSFGCVLRSPAAGGVWPVLFFFAWRRSATRYRRHFRNRATRAVLARLVPHWLAHLPWPQDTVITLGKDNRQASSNKRRHFQYAGTG